MEKIRLGRTDMLVSRLGFGGIPIQRLSEDETVAVVRRCLDLGVTFLDTANGYTTSEERIGKAIAGNRDGLIIATKSGSRTREGIEEHLKLSLQRLDIESIDLYQFHGVNNLETLDMVLADDGPMVVLEEALKSGVIKHIGITCHSMDVAKEAVKTDRFETIMFPFNFVTCEAADELLPLTREHDVGFIAMKPLAGGMLSNATIAFKYLLQFPDIIPIPGIEQVPEIEEIINIMESPLDLTEAEQIEMQDLAAELGTRFCHRCDYCQPCPVEIPISTVMNTPSFLKRMPPERAFSGMLTNAIEKAAECTDCGDCETRCPYELSIRDTISQYIEMYNEEEKRYQEIATT